MVQESRSKSAAIGAGDPRPPLDEAVLGFLRGTALPGAEIVTEGMPGDRHGYYWALAPYGAEHSIWVLPSRSGYGLGFLEKWHPARHHSYWRQLAEAYANGTLGGRRGIYLLRVPVDRTGYWEQFGWRNSIPPEIVAYVGAPRPWRKVVAGLVQRETGWPLLVVKFPLVRTARKYILDEAETLGSLELEKPGLAPRPVLLDKKRAILTEEALIGDDAGALLEPLHLPFLCALAENGTQTTLARRRRKLLNRARKVELPDRETGATLERAIAALDDRTPLPAVLVHGDLHSGNMVLRRNGQVQAVDWAFAERGGLPFHDIARAKLAATLARTGRKLEAEVDAESLAAYAHALGVAPGLYPKVVAWYAARDLLRRLRSGDGETAGIVRGKLDRWLKQHL